ncbi:MAG: secondary thiamine-phosphate synthase enzyme YjbQ [Phycisphaeraceae bacterium]|nr:secondary thiamine-phosphate synthase enzyme YjbQ [Phycisphaeraceae bacterium]
MVRRITVETRGKGLHDITDQVQAVVDLAATTEGLCTVFVQHTSASIVIQENTDPAVRRDLESWMSRLVRDGDPLFTHTDEGPDDMPSHIRSVLTATSVGIPVVAGRLGLGTWQAVYLWEHRNGARSRSVLVSIS